MTNVQSSKKIKKNNCNLLTYSRRKEFYFLFKIKSNITFLAVKYNLTKFYLELLAKIKLIS